MDARRIVARDDVIRRHDAPRSAADAGRRPHLRARTVTYNFARLTPQFRYLWRAAALACVLICAASCRGKRDATPPARDADWQHVATWSGHGNAQLETFPITGWTWRVQWET